MILRCDVDMDMGGVGWMVDGGWWICRYAGWIFLRCLSPLTFLDQVETNYATNVHNDVEIRIHVELMSFNLEFSSPEKMGLEILFIA